MADWILAGARVPAPHAVIIRSPWTGEVVGEAGLADTPEVDAAIAAAARAQPSLESLPSHRRRDLSRAIAAGILRDATS